MLNQHIQTEISRYDPTLSLDEAVTPPSSWYTSPEFSQLENHTVFTGNWLMVAREDQLRTKGQYVATEIGGEPIVIVMEDELRAFFNVCRHHAAIVMTGEGSVNALHCPYHGWTYNLDGSLRSTPQFGDVKNFDFSENSLVPIRVDTIAGFVFICLDETAPPLAEYVGELGQQLAELMVGLKFYRRVEYDLDCNWKVFVDNYLDGGYHVPIAHKGLNSAIDYRAYTTTLSERHATQSCSMSNDDAADQTRRGDMANYIWLYPNVMFNFYDGILDTNTVIPVSETKCRVIFDFYFSDDFSDEFKNQSIETSDHVQLEDEMLCLSVQKGLGSRSYDIGRLSADKEAGEQLFHQLLHKDYQRGY